MKGRGMFAGLVAVTLAAGCADLPLRRGEPSIPPTTKPETPAQPALVPATSATLALVNEAAAAEAGGDGERAAAILERAIRMEPADPLPWSRLAQLRLRQGQWRLAEQLAMKSNGLPGTDSTIKARNWRVIAGSRRLSGDDVGALVAEEQAERFGAR